MEFKNYWKGWYRTQSIRRKKEHLYKDNLERVEATKKNCHNFYFISAYF